MTKAQTGSQHGPLGERLRQTSEQTHEGRRGPKQVELGVQTLGCHLSRTNVKMGVGRSGLRDHLNLNDNLVPSPPPTRIASTRPQTLYRFPELHSTLPSMRPVAASLTLVLGGLVATAASALATTEYRSVLLTSIQTLCVPSPYGQGC